MTVIRVKHQKNFTTLSNSILQDSNLSLEAIGLWSHCMSRPENWIFYVSQLAESFKTSNKKIYKVINELIANGYAFKGQKREAKEESRYGNKLLFSKIEYTFFPMKISEEDKKSLEKEYSLSKFKKSFPLAQIQQAETQHAENDTLQKKEEIQIKEEIKKESAAPPPSPDGSALYDLFLQKIRERNPNFKEPKKEKWIKEFACLIDFDKRNVDEIKDLILWISDHSFWKSTCLSPHSLRKHYDKILMQKQSSQEKNIFENNRTFSVNLKKKYPDKLKNLTISQKYAMNLTMGKELPFDLPEETFRNALCQMFGGRYEPNRESEPSSDMENAE